MGVRRRKLPASGREQVELLLLAGLPNPLHNRASVLLEAIFGGNAKVIAVPSAVEDGVLFSSRTIETLLRGAADFVIHRHKTTPHDLPPTPKHIILFYVPAVDDEKLLSALDFFVFPVRLLALANYDESGHQKRHNIGAFEGAIEAALATSRVAAEFLGDVKRRISSVRSNEPLLLPPGNFHLADGTKLTRVFRELRRGTRTWKDPLPEVSVETFDRDRLRFLRPNDRKDIYRDARRVVFPCARPEEFHSLRRELDIESEQSEWRNFLRNAYRFGVPLPDGFHHDAQFEGGREFDKMVFDCASDGPVLVSGSHANIYPNDYIRAHSKKPAN